MKKEYWEINAPGFYGLIVFENDLAKCFYSSDHAFIYEFTVRLLNESGYVPIAKQPVIQQEPGR